MTDADETSPESERFMDQEIIAANPAPPVNRATSGWIIAAGVIAVLAWVVTFIQAMSLNSDLNDIVGNRRIDASAIQISQVADQSQLELMVFITGSMAFTVLFVVLVGINRVTARPQSAISIQAAKKVADVSGPRFQDIVVELPHTADPEVVRSSVERALSDNGHLWAASEYLSDTDDADLVRVLEASASWVQVKFPV